MKIKNSKGMETTLVAMAADDEHKIVFLSIIGAQTAVKAIWASLVGRQANLCVGHRIYTGSRDLEYVTLKYSPASGVHHWVIYAEPQPNDLTISLLPLNDQCKEDLLVRMLNQYTLWPVRAEWADELWERGSKGIGLEGDDADKSLIRPMKVFGLAWAYAVSTVGWDDVIDQAIKDNVLSFANTQKEVNEWHA